MYSITWYIFRPTVNYDVDRWRREDARSEKNTLIVVIPNIFLFCHGYTYSLQNYDSE